MGKPALRNKEKKLSGLPWKYLETWDRKKNLYFGRDQLGSYRDCSKKNRLANFKIFRYREKDTLEKIT